MATGEFDLPAGHVSLPAAAPTGFPDVGETEDAVIAEVATRLRENRYPPDRNFAITYSGRPQAISRRIEALAEGMLLAGNSLFGVASFDPDPSKPHRVEVRRWGAPWPFEVARAERVHSTTGEPGGTWRNRGRPPNGIVAVGTSAAGFDRAVPYMRMPDSHDPRVRFIFEGLRHDELIGDQPNLQTRWGAAGYEIDRFDHELGTPASALLLASSVGFSDQYRPMLDEVLWYIPGRDGKRPDDPQVEGEPHRFVRSDMAYLEYPNGGAVFSVGSIAWRGGIAHNGYDNSVARVTRNVLRRFADRPRGESPSDPASKQARVAVLDVLPRSTNST